MVHHGVLDSIHSGIIVDCIRQAEELLLNDGLDGGSHAVGGQGDCSQYIEGDPITKILLVCARMSRAKLTLRIASEFGRRQMRDRYE